MSEVMPPEETVNVTSPFGKVGSLPKSQASEAMENGYQPSTLDEINQAKNEDRFGGAQGAVFAGTLGAARSATLGGSDWALTSLPEGVGFSKEELKGFRDANPVSTGIGEVGGIFADPFGLAKVITTAGKATSAAAKTALRATTGLQDASTVSRVLTNALGSGVEGGLFGGITQSVDESVLGDAPLNSEKLLANVGYGAMIGGTLGGAFGLGSIGVRPAIRKAMDGLSSIRDDLIGSGYGEGEEALVHKILPQRFAEAITDRQLNLDTSGQASLLRKIVTNLNTVKDHIQGEVSSFEREKDPSVISSLFKISSKLAGEAQQNVSQFLGETVDKLQSMIPEGDTKVALEKLKEKAQTDPLISSSAQTLFNSLRKLKSHIGDFIDKEPTLDESLAPVQDKIDEYLRDPTVFGPAGSAIGLHEQNMAQLGKFISQDGKQTEFQKLFGSMNNGKWQFDIKKMNSVLAEKAPILRQKNLDLLSDFYNQLKEMPENLLNTRKSVPNSSWKKETLSQIIENSEKTNAQSFKEYVEGVKNRRPVYGIRDYAPVLLAKWHPILAAAIEAYDIYQDPVHASREMAYIERYLGKTAKKSLDLIDAVFNPSFASKTILENKINKPGGGSADLNEEHDKIKQIANNPNMVAEGLETQTKELQKIAPHLTDHLGLATSNAINFLSSKLPQNNQHMDPLGETYKPSVTELSKFERYRSIVEDPLISLEQVRNKTISPETIETLNTVYPNLYGELKQALIEKAFHEKAKGKIIPYQTKQAISAFIGQPLHASLSPQSILSNQMILASAPQPGQVAGTKTRAKGLDKMDRPGRASADYGAMSDT